MCLSFCKTSRLTGSEPPQARLPALRSQPPGDESPECGVSQPDEEASNEKLSHDEGGAVCLGAETSKAGIRRNRDMLAVSPPIEVH